MCRYDTAYVTGIALFKNVQTKYLYMKIITKIDGDLVFDPLEKIKLTDMVNDGYFIIQAYERNGLDDGYRIYSFLYDSKDRFTEQEMEELKRYQALKYSGLTQIQYNEHLDLNNVY